MANRPTGVTVSGILLILMGILGLFGALVLIFIGTIGASLIPMGLPGSDQAAVGFIGAVMGAIGTIVLIIAVLEIIVGVFVLKGASWARWVAIILAVLSLLSFPIGTIIGIIVIYFLLINKECKAFFEQPSAPSA